MKSQFLNLKGATVQIILEFAQSFELFWYEMHYFVEKSWKHINVIVFVAQILKKNCTFK